MESIANSELYRGWLENPTQENMEKMAQSFNHIGDDKAKVRYTSDNGSLVCCFNGAMDTKTSSDMEKDLLDKIKSLKAPTVFDLTDVNYVSSGFLRICLRAVQELGKQHFKITNAAPQIKKVLKISGFESIAGCL